MAEWIQFQDRLDESSKRREKQYNWVQNNTKQELMTINSSIMSLLPFAVDTFFTYEQRLTKNTPIRWRASVINLLAHHMVHNKYTQLKQESDMVISYWNTL